MSSSLSPIVTVTDQLFRRPCRKDSGGQESRRSQVLEIFVFIPCIPLIPVCMIFDGPAKIQIYRGERGGEKAFFATSSFLRPD
jgi:hypothetical protein